MSTSNKMAPYHRTQSRILKTSGSRSVIRLSDVTSAFRYIMWSLTQVLFKIWHLNPVSLMLRRWRQLHHLNTRMALRIRPRLIDLATDFFLSDERRKRKLLFWVKSILPWLGEEVFDFTACWQDGIVLCALMESVSPGACPRFNLLKPHHRVNNCRLGIQLAMRYLQVTELPLSPEEMAIADEDSEVKICHLVQLLKWKYQKQRSRPTVCPSITVDQPIPCKCQARGTGIKAGIVGRRAKFNILSDTVTNLDLLIEIRGPNNEYNKEKIISMHPGVTSRYRDHVIAAAVSSSEDDGKTKVIDDGAGHSFLRQKSLEEESGHLVIPFDYQCVGEGRFLVTYIPRNAGLHYITVLSAGVHIQGSPFEVKVSDWVSSWNLVPKPRVVPFDMLQPVDEQPKNLLKPTDRIMRKLSHVAQVSKQLTKMKRRILRKVITPNGEEIICDVTPTLSRQNSDDLDLSGDEKRTSKCEEPENRSDIKNDKTSVKIKGTNDSTRTCQYLGGSTSMENSRHHHRSSSSHTSDRSSGNGEAAFLATVIAARAAAVSSEVNLRRSTSLTATSYNNLPTNPSSKQNKLESLKIQHRQINNFDKDEQTTPEIVITPDFDHHMDGPRFYLGDHKQILDDDTKDENMRTSLPLSDGESKADSASCTTSDIENFSVPSEYNSLPERKNSTSPTLESAQDLSSGDKNSRSKAHSPSPKVSDIVATLLNSLKQDKVQKVISPAHGHYMRSFSLDETYKPHVHAVNNVEEKRESSSPLTSLALASSYLENNNTVYCSQRQHMPLADIPTAISTNHRSHTQSQECARKSSVGEYSMSETKNLQDVTKSITSRLNIAESDKVNGCPASSDEEDTHTCYNNAGGEEMSCDGMYCSGCFHCKKEPAIKKQDLDQRVCEIIEEASERDSLLREEEASEASLDGTIFEDASLEDVISDFTNEAQLVSRFSSLTNIGKDKDAASLKFNHGQNSSSFDSSDFRPKHKMLWSQHKSLSDERKMWRSLSCMDTTDSLAGKNWADVSPISPSNEPSLSYFKDTEPEQLIPGNEIHDYNSAVNNQYEFKIFAKENSNTLFDNNGSNKNSEVSRRKNWSQSRSMSFPSHFKYLNDSYCKQIQDGVFSFKGVSIRDQMNKLKRWTTFDGFSSIDGINAYRDEMCLDKIGRKQQADFNDELFSEDDEILQIIIEPNLVLSSMDDKFSDTKEPLFPTTSNEATKEFVSEIICKSSCSSSENTSPIPEHEDKCDRTQVQREDITRVSPRSNMSNKSDNSDWSDNENSPSAFSLNHKSAQQRDFLKGDWSPQFVDLTYGSITSHQESPKTTSRRSSRDSNKSDTNKYASLRENEDKYRITVISPGSSLTCKIEGESSKSVQSISSVTTGIGCEQFSATSPFANNFKGESVISSAASVFTKNYHNYTSSVSEKQTMNNRDHHLVKHVTNNSAGEADSDEQSVYIKRRRRPVYKVPRSPQEHSTCRSCSQANTSMKHQARSNDSANNGQNFTNNNLHPNRNINSVSEPKTQFCDQSKNTFFFSTLGLLSPDIADFLLVDNWSSLSNSYAMSTQAFQDTQAFHVTDDNNVCSLCEDNGVSYSFSEHIPSQAYHFRECTLTPTKHRVQQQESRENFKTSRRAHQKQNALPQETSNIFYPSFNHQTAGSVRKITGSI